MENRIITAVFKESKNTKVSDVWQWDYGQILRIQGLNLPTAVEVDFAVTGASESIARIGTTKDGVTDVVIPDSLIETGNNLVAYIYLRDSKSGNTEYQIDMLVTKRAKPEAYDTPEDKELFGQAIEAVNAAADRAEKAGQTAQEAATKAGQDAEQTAQDRAEVAKMVETVTDISEQVKKVEDLSNKAQAAATKTEADAQQTAEDRAEVGKMLENVKDISEQVKSVDESVRKAKESEQAAARHRTAVEEIKNSVEQTASAFPQTVQEGVQAVENAGASESQGITQVGTAQKTAVESAGAKAVENVENVKASATEAVETAKTEAVQVAQAEGTKQTGSVAVEGAKQVKAVQDKGIEVLQSIPEDFRTQMETKLNKQQGIENKGKALVIGEDGNVVPGEVQSGGGDGIAIINTMSSVSPLVIPDSAERVNKGISIIGGTEQTQDPSPSTEYPQEIKNSGKWNEEKQKYEVDVKIAGRNLFDAKKAKSGRITTDGKQTLVTLGNSDNVVSDYIQVYSGMKYTSSVGVYKYFYDSEKIFLKQDASISSSMIIPDNAKYMIVIVPVNKALAIQTANTLMINIGSSVLQIEIGAIRTEFEPYTEQTLTLTSDRPITKWDRLVEQGGQIGWLYKSRIAGIPKTGYALRNASENRYGVYFSKLNIFKDAVITKGSPEKDSNIFTHFRPGNPYSSNGDIAWLYVAGGNTDLRIKVDDETINTVELFEQYISDKDIKILYETESTEFFPLPESEQNAIRALKTYYPTTVIMVDGGEVIPTVEVTYTADTKNYIDGKLSAKVASVSRQYQADTVNLLSLMPMETQATMIENDTNNILENVEEMKHE